MIADNVDIDGKGCTNESQFILMMARMDKDTDGEHMAAFRMFDIDNDGFMQKLGV